MVTSNAATGYVAKISMLRLNIGAGKLSSCMLIIGPGPKCEQGKGGPPRSVLVSSPNHQGHCIWKTHDNNENLPHLEDLQDVCHV